MLKMAVENAKFVTLLFLSYVTGLASTICDYTEHATYGLADVAHMHRFNLAIHSSNSEWYRDGMKSFAYSHNGRKWQKTDLTWGFSNESSNHALLEKVELAAFRAFNEWSVWTPFQFNKVYSFRDRPDIEILIGSTGSKDLLCDTIFPPKDEKLDDAGVTIVINDALEWDYVPQSSGVGVYNLNFALLYEVSHCLGLGHSNNPEAVMSSTHPRFDIDADYELQRDDIDGIERLYKFYD